MRSKTLQISFATIAACLSLLPAPQVLARGGNYGWTFNYQGSLRQSGLAVNGLTPITFRLFADAVGGTQVGNDIVQNVNVVNGLFTAELDFTEGGTLAGVFDGTNRWLEVQVNGTILTPRQKLQATPHAAVATLFQVPLGMDTVSPVIMHLKSHANEPQVRALLVETYSTEIGAHAITGIHNEDDNEGVGVYGMSTSSNGFGVAGANLSPTGNNTGIYGLSVSPQGTAIGGLASSPSGVTKAIFGSAVSPQGYGGYFEGKGYFSKFTGVGRDFAIGSEIFGVGHPATTGYGGMYVETAGAGAWPFYGYATNGAGQMWHYYDGSTDKWHLHHGTNRITVESGGQVGIGTESPAFLLHVNGSAGKPGGGSWTNASDVRLKHNIHELDGALHQLLSLRGVTFEYLDPASINELPGVQIGMIAQEVEQVFPQWVDTAEDGYKRVTYRGFESLTVEALRELREQKDAEIQSLRDENQKLLERLEHLEAAIAQMASK